MTFHPSKLGRSPLTDRAASAVEYQQSLEAAGVPSWLADRATCIRTTGCFSPEDELMKAQVQAILKGEKQVNRPLTDKELKVIAAFDEKRPGLGEIVRKNILNPRSDWPLKIAAMQEEDIVCRTYVPGEEEA